MRKMMNKKGFTLVELMIVVVILGILVAIAVPIYSAVTKNAKRKACQGDIRIIRSNLASYIMTGGTDGAMLTTAPSNIYNEANFAKMFDNNVVPQCPNAKANYVVTFKTDDITKFTIACPATDENGCPNFGKDSDGNTPANLNG